MANPWHELAERFRKASVLYPNLRHTLTEASEVPPMDFDNLDECPNYRLLIRKMNAPSVCFARSKTPNIVHLICCFHRGCEHVFYGEVERDKAESWERFRELAAIGEDLASEQGLFRPKRMIPMPASLIAQDYETASWMELVYAIAREKLPTILRAQTSTIWNTIDLPEGMTASWLGLDVFTASACAAEALAIRERRPSFERVRTIAIRLARFLEAADIANRDHSSTRAKEEAIKGLFRQCQAMNEALGGGPIADEEIRQASGWDLETRVTLANLATDFELIIGNGQGRWGLRAWEKREDGRPVPSSRMEWPSFGELGRHEPFQFGANREKTFGRIREALFNLNNALGRLTGGTPQITASLFETEHSDRVVRIGSRSPTTSNVIRQSESEPDLHRPLTNDAQVPTAHVPASRVIETPVEPLNLDDRAVALLTRWYKEDRSKISKRKLAKALNCHPSSLRDCPTFNTLWAASQGVKPPSGYRDSKTGNLEADDDY